MTHSSDLDNLENNSSKKSSWGGARPGSGRPRGSENEQTKQRRVAEEAMKDRIVRSTESLLNSQMALAKGEVNLYHVYYTGTGKDRKKHVDIVSNQETVTQFLAGELDEANGEYHYIATKTPDNRSIDSLLDRTYGKAKQAVDLTSDGEKLGVALSAEQFDQLAQARARRTDS